MNEFLKMDVFIIFLARFISLYEGVKLLIAFFPMLLKVHAVNAEQIRLREKKKKTIYKYNPHAT